MPESKKQRHPQFTKGGTGLEQEAATLLSSRGWQFGQEEKCTTCAENWVGRAGCNDRSNIKVPKWGHTVGKIRISTDLGWFIIDNGTPYRLSLLPRVAIDCVNGWLAKACLWVKDCKSSVGMLGALK